jgi:hypothetical protein
MPYAATEIHHGLFDDASGTFGRMDGSGNIAAAYSAIQNYLASHPSATY